MRRTLSLALVSLIALAVLGTAATVASAATVRDSSGAVVGSVKGSTNGHVWDAAGARVGYYGLQDGEETFVFHQEDSEPYALVDKASSTRYLVRTAAMGPVRYGGRVVKSGGKWILQRKVSGAWKTRGRIATPASGWGAGAALWLLLW
jgi:hypothetical protein